MRLSIANLSQLISVASLWTIANLLGVAQDPVRASSGVVFDCSRNPKTRIYSTVVKFANSKTREVIQWKPEYIKNPRTTCRQVSDKFQQQWEAGKLNHLKTGRSAKTGRFMICGLADRNTPCTEQTKIFDLSPSSNDPKVALGSLLQSINDKDGNSPLYQSSDDVLVVDFRGWIANIGRKI